MIRLKNIFQNAAFSLNILLLFFLVFENKLVQLPPWMQVAGRLHPMLIHFPIVLLIVIASFEWMFARRETDKTWKEKMQLLISFTSLSASGSAILGLLLYHSGDYQGGTTIMLHKWMGIAIALLTGSLIWLRKMPRVVYNTMLTASIIIIIATGHFGASITHGENFITQPLELPPSKIQNLDKAYVFSDLIQPVTNEKCVGCHNPNKAKGELLLTSPENILKGGKDGEVIVPGSPDSSLLYRNILLPLDDDKHMPPEGKPQLDEEEIKLIYWWIASGADFKRTLASLKPPDSIFSIIKSKYGMESPLEAIDISFAGLRKINSFNNLKRGVRQLSLDRPYVSIFLANRKDISTSEIEELNPLKEQIISVDFSNSNVTDEHIKTVANFPHIQKLYLENTNITDTGIRSLKRLPYLEYLNISNTNVSERSLAELNEFKSLRKVFFYQTNIPALSIIAYKAAHRGIIVGYTPDLSMDTAFAGKLAEPTVKIDSNLFTNFATVKMEYRLKGVAICYTTNGRDPDSSSSVYDKPLKIDSSCELKTIAVRKGWKNSEINEYHFLRSKFQFAGAALNPLPDKRYRGRLDTTLIDLQKGSESQGDGKYIGYEGNDVMITLSLPEKKLISSIGISYVVNHGSFILSPTSIEVWGSSQINGPQKRLAGISNHETIFKPGSSQASLFATFAKRELVSFKIKITNAKTLPKWHPNAGQKSWIFLDEIVVN